jgi:hypothetical protein
MDKYTKEQTKQLKTAAFKFLLKSLWNGAQHGAMLLVMNVMIQLSMAPIFDNDQFCFFVLTVASFLVVFIRVRAVQKENLDDYTKEVKGITKDEGNIS